MSQLIARQVLNRLNMQISMISMHGVQDIAADLRQLSLSDAKSENAKSEERKPELLEAYGFAPNAQVKPFAFFEGVAVIPIHGSLINRFGASWGYVTGYNFIRAQLTAAMMDDDVKYIIFDCNSYGGEAAGCFELADEIFAWRGTKPMTAVIDSNSYSACYALASAADRVVLTPTGGVGSIGVVAMHMSFEKVMESYGIKVSLIYAGAHKVDGNPFEDLPDTVRADIQRSVDGSYGKFAALVARNRGLEEQAVRATEARMFRAEDALAAGLIDEIATPSATVAALLTELSSSELDDQGFDMTDEEKAAAAQDVRNAERARMSAITTSEEAKGREALANHLAFSTSMTADEAKAALAVAPLASAATPAAAAPVVAAPAAEAKGDPTFAAHMDAINHPNTTAGADGAQVLPNGQQATVKPGSKLLDAYKAATGKDIQ